MSFACAVYLKVANGSLRIDRCEASGVSADFQGEEGHSALTESCLSRVSSSLRKRGNFTHQLWKRRP